MKVLLSIASVFALSAASAFAGDGQISQQSLANLGLGGMKGMSDTEGMAIRGMAAVATVYGTNNSGALKGTDGSNSYYGNSTHIIFGFAVGGSTSTSSTTVSVVGLPTLTITGTTTGKAAAFAL